MGASQGIGRAIALKLADNGFHTVINSRVPENIESVKKRSSPNIRMRASPFWRYVGPEGESRHF